MNRRDEPSRKRVVWPQPADGKYSSTAARPGGTTEVMMARRAGEPQPPVTRVTAAPWLRRIAPTATELARQVAFDSDIWIVAVEDGAGRHFLDDWLASA